MDIDLLSKMIKELILDNDEVTLPGVGCFVAEVVPASFSDRGYTVNPPYRRLYFRQRQDDADTLLSDFYARTNQIEPEDARRILEDFLSEMKALLQERKTLLFPGLGRLRATRENNFFFVADEDLDIYPAGFGLEPISLKTHQESPEEVATAVAGLRAIVAPVIEEAPAEEAPAVEEVPSEASAGEAPVVEEVPSEASAEEIPVVEEAPAVEVVPEEVPGEVLEEAPVEETPVDLIVTADQLEETPVVEEQPAEEEAPAEEAVSAGDESPAGEDAPAAPRKHTFLWVLLALVLLALLALAVFLVLVHLAPDFIDRLLYTPEQLEILRQ